MIFTWRQKPKVTPRPCCLFCDYTQHPPLIHATLERESTSSYTWWLFFFVSDVEDAGMPEIRLRLLDTGCSPYMFVRPFLQKKQRLHRHGLKGFWRSHFGRFELSLTSVQFISMPRHISPNPRWTNHVHHPIVLVVYISQGSAFPVPSNPPSLLISSRLLLDCFTIPFVTVRMFASVALIK